MHSFERTILKKIEDNLDIIVFVFLTIAAIIIRYPGRDFVSRDMERFLIPWFKEIKSAGGFAALSKQVGNYGILYQTLIAIMTYIDANPVYMYKVLSIIFDFVLAFGASLLACEIKKEKKFSFTFNLVYGLVLCIPVFIFNSSYWGQCDSIYVSFVILALYYLYKEKYISSFVLLGVALSFKLQTVYILPFFVLNYIKNKKFSIFLFVIPLVVLLISGLPAVIYGRSIFTPIEIYKGQASRSSYLTRNFNSFWNIMSVDPQNMFYISLFTAFISNCLIIYIVLKDKLKFNKDNFLEIAILMVWPLMLLLPEMHERYDYLLIVLLIILLAIKHDYYISSIIAICISHITTTAYLFGNRNGTSKFLAALAVFAYVIYARKAALNNKIFESINR